MAGVHVFQANSPSVQKCQVDVGFTPKPDEQGTRRMCFKAGWVIQDIDILNHFLFNLITLFTKIDINVNNK